jgi:hypothetical protein
LMSAMTFILRYWTSEMGLETGKTVSDYALDLT